MATKTHWKNLANYDYLGAYSLEGVSSVVLTIKETKKQMVTNNSGKVENCIVGYFEEVNVGQVQVKPMVLNKTNCKTISSLYGDFVEDWVGKKIEIFATETKFGRETVPCLRVKKIAPIVIKEVFHCAICGNTIDKKTYDASVSKYGIALCSKACLDKHNEGKEEKVDEKRI